MPNRPKRSASRHLAQAAQLAEMVRDARLNAGFSQQELATRAGVAIGTVRALESKRTVDPGFFTVQVLARALNIQPEDLPRVEEQAPRTPPAPEADLGDT